MKSRLATDCKVDTNEKAPNDKNDAMNRRNFLAVGLRMAATTVVARTGAAAQAGNAQTGDPHGCHRPKDTLR